MSEIQLYSDEACTDPISKISWDEAEILKLVTGKEVTLENASKGGKPAKATIYIKNNTRYRYYIVQVVLSDDRLKFEIEKAFIDPGEKIKLTIIFDVPNEPKPEDVIKESTVDLNGYFVYE